MEDFIKQMTEAAKDLTKEQVIEQWANNVRTDGDQQTCLQQHQGQCGVCISGNWIPCG